MTQEEHPHTLGLIQRLLLCGLRLIQLNLHHRHSAGPTASMYDPARREISSWVSTENCTGSNDFWDEAVEELQGHDVFSEDQRDLTVEDVAQEFDDILRCLRGTPLGGSGRFSWRQRLVILCFGFEIHPPALEFPDQWCEWDDGDLNELAGLLSNSSLFVKREEIDCSCVATWLKDLGVLLCSSSMQRDARSVYNVVPDLLAFAVTHYPSSGNLHRMEEGEIGFTRSSEKGILEKRSYQRPRKATQPHRHRIECGVLSGTPQPADRHFSHFESRKNHHKMCKTNVVSFTLACGHYSMHGEEPCASALARDPTSTTPCDELINELELQRVSGSCYFVINFKGQSITVHQTSSEHCDAWRKAEYTKPNYPKEASQSPSAATAVSNSDGSAMSNSDQSGSLKIEAET
ncbi:MAG: hypothetical protein M1839_007298 [Geoglossum umbratile]|nr:MAG: hypothetical protein M1839_007298 [Geoglossum umbratile]